MKLKLKQLKPNPYKKMINEGKIHQEQVDRLKTNLDELGLMGAFPIVKRKNNYHLVCGHHRHEALKQLHGDDFEVEVTLHDYTDEQLFKGMVIENLTQRKGEFQEERENIVAIHEYLKNIIRSTSEQNIKGRWDEGRKPESGSIRHIHEWLHHQKNENEIMSIGKIGELLKINRNLAPDLLEQVEKTHKGPADRRGKVLSLAQAGKLATIESHDEQHDLWNAMQNSREQNVRDQLKLITTYKEMPEEIKTMVRQQNIDIADMQDYQDEIALKKQAEKRPKYVFIPNFKSRIKTFNKNLKAIEKQVDTFSKVFNSPEFSERYIQESEKNQKIISDAIFNLTDRLKHCSDEIESFNIHLKKPTIICEEIK